MKVLAFGLLVVSSFSISLAQANVGEAFGYGSRIGALGGAGVSWGSGPFAAYHNPAALAAIPSDHRLQFGFGFGYMQPNFLPIQNVVTQNAFNADNEVGNQTTGSVETNDYRATFGQTLAFSYRLFPDLMKMTFGLVSYFPVNQIAYTDTGESFLPEYFLYRSRTQRPQFDLGLGAQLTQNLYIGVGMHVAFSLTGGAKVFLNSSTNTSSWMRFSSSLQPKAAPFFGLLYTPVENPRSFSFGAVVRLPVTSEGTLKMDSSARMLGNLNAADISFTSTNAIFYDPMSLELGTGFDHFFPFPGHFSTQLDFQVWNAYQAPAMEIPRPTGTFSVNPSSLPSYNYVNIWVPRVGEEISLSDTTAFRLGYAYRPSILADVSNGKGNYLDPSKHIATVGLGLHYQTFLGMQIPNDIDFHFAYHLLMKQTVTKTSGNEAGVSGDRKIGSPGYDAGGNLYGGGLSLSLAI